MFVTSSGLQQLHIITKEGQEKGEVIDGHIALIVPSIDNVVKSLNYAVQKYKSFHNFNYKVHIYICAVRMCIVWVCACVCACVCVRMCVCVCVRTHFISNSLP